MKDVFIRMDAWQTGEPLPVGELEFHKVGHDGFVIRLVLPTDPVALRAAEEFLQDIAQIIHYMRDASVQDVAKGLSLLSDAETYFTTWRHPKKMVSLEKYEHLQRDLDAAIDAKRALQDDNDRSPT